MRATTWTPSPYTVTCNRCLQVVSDSHDAKACDLNRNGDGGLSLGYIVLRASTDDIHPTWFLA